MFRRIGAINFDAEGVERSFVPVHFSTVSTSGSNSSSSFEFKGTSKNAQASHAAK